MYRVKKQERGGGWGVYHYNALVEGGFLSRAAAVRYRDQTYGYQNPPLDVRGCEEPPRRHTPRHEDEQE